jgi:hypothetical protein
VHKEMAGLPKRANGRHPSAVRFYFCCRFHRPRRRPPTTPEVRSAHVDDRRPPTTDPPPTPRPLSPSPSNDPVPSHDLARPMTSDQQQWDELEGGQRQRGRGDEVRERAGGVSVSTLALRYVFFWLTFCFLTDYFYRDDDDDSAPPPPPLSPLLSPPYTTTARANGHVAVRGADEPMGPSQPITSGEGPGTFLFVFFVHQTILQQQ